MKLGSDGEYGLVQGGVAGNPKKMLAPVAHESTVKTGLSHTDGAVSMARAAPGSAAGDFFITIGPLTSLDARPQAAGDNAGFAVFGQVVEGMDVVRKIQNAPVSATLGSGVMKGQMLADPVKILTVRRVK
ncbi:MAG: peptidylprolyl isomerase, partial [Polymorphobacter sp.]